MTPKTEKFAFYYIFRPHNWIGYYFRGYGALFYKKGANKNSNVIPKSTLVSNKNSSSIKQFCQGLWFMAQGLQT